MSVPDESICVELEHDRNLFGGITGSPKGETPQGGTTPSAN